MPGLPGYLDRYRPGEQAKEVGIGGFTALARVRESYKLAADAPDTPVEDGSFVHDHVILKPVTLSIEGSVSDVHIRRNPLVRDFIRVQAEVGNLSSQYASGRTQSQINKLSALANEAADAIRQIDALVAAGEQAAKFFGNKDAQSKPLREQFLDAMEALHFGQQAFTIDMPHRQFTSMVITTLTLNTDNEAEETVFTLEAKQLTFARLQVVEVAPSAGTGGQLETETDQGTQAGAPVEKSLATNLLELIR